MPPPNEHWFITQEIGLAMINKVLKQCYNTQYDTKLGREHSIFLDETQVSELQGNLLRLHVYITEYYKYDLFEPSEYCQFYNCASLNRHVSDCMDTHSLLWHYSILRDVPKKTALHLYQPYYDLLNIISQYRDDLAYIEDDKNEKL